VSMDRRTLVLFALFILCRADAATVAPQPRIVSLAPNLTELTFSAGAGSQIVGTVEFSDYPQAARAIPRIGDAFRIDYERLLALHPDVVFAWESGTPKNVIERLRALNVNVRVIATYRIADISVAMREIGAISGTAAIAERVGGKQIMSEIVSLCGGRNVFADLNDLAPEIGEEAVIAADPQVILATDNSGDDALEHWRHWQRMKAVKTGNLYVLPPDDMARPTTRLALGAAELCRTLETARHRLGLSR